jgi:hypothetical protein
MIKMSKAKPSPKKPAKPTAEEIKVEIEKLREMKPKLPRTTKFGDDNHAAIDAEIEVLENDLDEDEIYSKGPEDEDHDDSEWSQHQMEAALYTRQWMEGEAEDGSPSEGWAPLVQK